LEELQKRKNRTKIRQTFATKKWKKVAFFFLYETRKTSEEKKSLFSWRRAETKNFPYRKVCLLKMELYVFLTNIRSSSQYEQRKRLEAIHFLINALKKTRIGTSFKFFSTGF
jgi:hypothetical protein